MKRNILIMMVVMAAIFCIVVPERDQVQANGYMTGVIIVEPFGVAEIDHEAYRGHVLITPEYGTPLRDSSGGNKNETVTNKHGMESLSVAARNINSCMFIPVCGDLRNQSFYDRIKKAIVQYDARFVNMSLSFMVRELPIAEIPDRDTFRTARSAAYILIYRQKNVLFTVAAGNGLQNGLIKTGVNIDFFPQYPVANTPDNMVTVGSVNTDKIETGKLDKYQMSVFSNFGFKSVDILAPGENVKVAGPGNTYGREKGTSFSAPYILNLLLKLSAHTDLTVLKLKELLLKSAYVPNIDLAMKHNLHDLSILRVEQLTAHPGIFPVRSGGIVFPERAKRTLNILRANPQLSVGQAVLKARNYVLGPGEDNTPETQEKLERFWQMRLL